MPRSFWRKSAYWWLMLASMLCTGTSFALGPTRASAAYTITTSVFMIGAYSLAAIAAAMVITTWISHRRSLREEDH